MVKCVAESLDSTQAVSVYTFHYIFAKLVLTSMLQISRPKTEYKANDQGKEEKKVSCTSQFAANYALIYLSGARFLRCLLPFSYGCCWCLWGYCIRHCCCHFADAVPGDSALCICFSVCGAWACSCLIAVLVSGRTHQLLPPGTWFRISKTRTVSFFPFDHI